MKSVTSCTRITHRAILMCLIAGSGLFPAVLAEVTEGPDPAFSDSGQSLGNATTRAVAAGSPDLTNAINTELGKYDNLQDFVGLSYDEWAMPSVCPRRRSLKSFSHMDSSRPHSASPQYAITTFNAL